MATQQTVPHSLSVVPFPAVEPITQLELTVFLSWRGRLQQLEEQVKQAEQSVKARLDHGAALESGDHRAQLKENFRRNVSWKDVVIRLANRLRMDGEAYCAKVLNSTKPTAPFRWSSSNAHDHTSQGRTREAIPPGTVLPIPALSLAHSEVEPSNWRPRAWRLLPASSGSGPTMNNTHNSQLSFVSSAYLRCPNCNSTKLKKVSLAYQEGLFCTVARTRLRAVVLGGYGPDFVIGKATTRGFHQSALSKQLSPPVKWSYRKLILWWARVFLSIGWIVFYVNTITKNSAAVLSFSLILFSGLSAITFLLLLVLFWRHNQSAYKRRYSQWERSFLCQRCGTLTERE